MKKSVGAAAALVLFPFLAQAQDIQPLPGFYVGAGAGIVKFLDTSTSIGGGVSSSVGFGFGALIGGYDFVGPRVEVEAAYGQTNISANIPVGQRQFNIVGRQIHVMAKVLYDFFPASAITPYVGAGAGVGFIATNSAFGTLSLPIKASSGWVGT